MSEEQDAENIEFIRPESTAVLVSKRLRDLVSRGHFSFGERLPEAKLAKQFGVSRGVLREALQRLTQEGLLVGRPNRGVFVADFDADDIFDIYTARLAVERGACLKVIDVNGNMAEVADKLDAITDQLEEKAAAGASGEELVWLDIDFHELMVIEAKSPRLTRMHRTLATESRMCQVSFEVDAFGVEDRVREHRQIAAAIRAGDVPQLHTLLAQHMDHAVQVVMQRFEDNTSA
ncbi:MAG: GntR family transcriptional regulator [Galactobacter sp.]